VQSRQKRELSINDVSRIFESCFDMEIKVSAAA
jgi:hypothetical protein